MPDQKVQHSDDENEDKPDERDILLEDDSPKDIVDEASDELFPASDPPGWIFSHDEDNDS